MSDTITLSLFPNVVSFGWSLLVEGANYEKTMDIAYSHSHGQLVVAPEDMRALTPEEISVIEAFEQRMISHINLCEENKSLTIMSFK